MSNNILSLRKVFTNKVVFYLVSRYLTYFIQFVTSMIIAAKLGPYYMGIWGFVMLLLSYFQQIHFGIANSLNVLLIHHKDNKQCCDAYILNSMFLIGGLSLLVFLLAGYYYLWGIESFQKYQLDNRFYWICVIAILQYFNGLFINILRVRNKITQVAICQSIIVFLNFTCIFFFSGSVLVNFLILGYVSGNIFCIILACACKIIPSWSRYSIRRKILKEILYKGLYLFLYNSCFYFIIISIRTLVGFYYSVNEFGIFTFSYSLANAIMLLLDAFAFVIFPKVINKLSSDSFDEVENTLRHIRGIYISSAHFLVYLAFVFFPLLLYFMPQYSDALQVINLISLSILMNTNSFGYSTLLIARNKEKYSAIISIGALIINCFLGFLLVCVFKVGFSLVILATMITYLLFSFIITVVGKKTLGHYNICFVFKEFLPYELLIPYLVAVIVSIISLKYLMFLPVIIYLIFNWKNIFFIKQTLLKVLRNPNVANI